MPPPYRVHIPGGRVAPSGRRLPIGGTVLAEFRTLDGKPRVVVELDARKHPAGQVRVYAPRSLTRLCQQCMHPAPFHPAWCDHNP